MTMTILTTLLLGAMGIEAYRKTKKEVSFNEDPMRFVASSQSKFNNFKKKQR